MQFPRVQNQLVQLAVGNSYVRHCTSGGSVVIYGDADNDHSGNYHNYWEISGLAPSAGIYDNLWKISNYDNCWQLLTMWEKNLQTISGQPDHSAHIILCDLDEGLFRGGRDRCWGQIHNFCQTWQTLDFQYLPTYFGLFFAKKSWSTYIESILCMPSIFCLRVSFFVASLALDYFFLICIPWSNLMTVDK